MKSYTPKEVIKLLLKHNWYLKRARGGHYIFENEDSKNNVVVPVSKNIIPIGTIKNIEKQSGIKFK